MATVIWGENKHLFEYRGHLVSGCHVKQRRRKFIQFSFKSVKILSFQWSVISS